MSFVQAVIRIVDTVILLLPLFVQISPNVECSYELEFFPFIHQHQVEQVLQGDNVVLFHDGTFIVLERCGSDDGLEPRHIQFVFGH